jgi:DNA-binding PadR family transcriptional regulator
MEYFILGLLMSYKFTAYEIHINIKNNFQGICSDSIGNIQRALKKLAGAESVTFESVVENEVNKKIYTITPKGREVFLKWLDNPIEINKAKNMEVSRLLLMGYLDNQQQLQRIDEAIGEMEVELEYYKEIHKMRQGYSEILASQENLAELYMSEMNKRATQEFLDELVRSSPVENLGEIIMRINKFGGFTLDLALAECEFFLNWFRDLRKKLAEEYEKNE